MSRTAVRDRSNEPHESSSGSSSSIGFVDTAKWDVAGGGVGARDLGGVVAPFGTVKRPGRLSSCRVKRSTASIFSFAFAEGAVTLL